MAAQAITRKSWIGGGVETTPGTVITAPKVYLPAKSTMKFKQDEDIPDEERASVDEVFDRIPTTRHGEADPKGKFYFDSSPLILLSWFGTDTATQPDATGAPTAWKHALSLTDVPKFISLYKSYHSVVYSMSYCATESWTLKYTAEKKVIEFESVVRGLFPVKYTGAPITPTFSTVKSIAGYKPTLTLGGTSTTDISELTIKGERKLTPWYGMGGSPDFVSMDVGGRKVEVDFTARFDTDTVFNRYLTNVDDSLLVDVAGPLIGGTTSHELNVNVPVIAYSDGEMDTGKDNVLVKMKAHARSTSSGLISAFIINTVNATGY